MNLQGFLSIFPFSSFFLSLAGHYSRNF
jgi:hypothetical protein